MERDDAVTMKGNPLTLIGPELKKGDQAPDFRCVENLGSEISLENFGNDVKVFQRGGFGGYAGLRCSDQEV